MKKLLATLLFLTIPLTSFAAGMPKPVYQTIPNAELIGSGRQTSFIFNIFDAALYASNGKYDEQKPYALSLTYLRNLNGEEIVVRSIEEIRGQGYDNEEKLAAWQEQMSAFFPDVIEGTTLTGITTKSGESVFYKNDQMIGKISDPEFAKRFFGIWLSPETSEPDLRANLLKIEVSMKTPTEETSEVNS